MRSTNYKCDVINYSQPDECLCENFTKKNFKSVENLRRYDTEILKSIFSILSKLEISIIVFQFDNFKHFHQQFSLGFVFNVKYSM